jgi:Cu(I)/Ag(I) efflux system membrane fusion protein
LQAITTGNKRLVQASEYRLDVLGMSKTQIRKLIKDKTPAQYVSTYASQSGVISKLNVREGMHVKPETEIMVLANLDTVWIQAEVFERQVNWVKVGQDVEARLPSVPGRIWKGEVDYVYPGLDPNTRTLRVRLRFDNPEEFLKPNMYADVSIISEHTGPVIHIPREALILDGHAPRVIVALGNGRYQAREVVPGVESSDRVEIMEGLDETDLLVVSAQFLIDSEANLKASLRRMEPVIQEPGMHHLHPAGEGTINDIKLDARTINISHEPIELLDWPAMTMDIGVADHIDLDTIKTQSRVEFHLVKDKSGTYVISDVSPIENGQHKHD